MTAPLWQASERRLVYLTLRGALGVHRAAELAPLVDKFLSEEALRAQRARQNTQAYSQRVAKGIRLALGEPPVGDVTTAAWRAWRRKMPAIVLARIKANPAAFGLLRKPDDERVRAVIRAVEAERSQKTG